MDLLVVGAPTQHHGLPAPVRELLESTRQGRLRQVWSLAFDTRYPRAKWVTGSAAKATGKLLRLLGCHVLAEQESFFVEGAGRPLEPGEE